MSPALVVKQGPLAGQKFELGAETVVGRDDAGIKIDDPEMSRHHAVIRGGGSRLEIEDLDSLNGTWVNGTRIGSATPLSEGDVVKVGATTFAVEGVSRASATVASPQPVATPAAASAPSEAPAEPFGVHATQAPTRRGIASRQLGPTLVSFAAVFGTAVALAVYFALH